MTSQTGREDFTESWLVEMPESLGSFETWDQIDYIIKDRIANGSRVHHLANGLCKIEGQQTLFYWYGDSDTIILGIELYIKPQTLIVDLVGKNRQYRGRPPYASDLYDAILKDRKKPIRIISDTDLSDDGFAMWKRLLMQGHKVSVYDAKEPGRTFKTFTSPEEMDEYLGDRNYTRYQFVLTEAGEVLAETRSLFNTRRYRELISGLL